MDNRRFESMPPTLRLGHVILIVLVGAVASAIAWATIATRDRSIASPSINVVPGSSSPASITAATIAPAASPPQPAPNPGATAAEVMNQRLLSRIDPVRNPAAYAEALAHPAVPLSAEEMKILPPRPATPEEIAAEEAQLKNERGH